MAPTDRDILAETQATVSAVHKQDTEDDTMLLTVKYIRDKVQKKLGLEEGFFLTPPWRERSKTLIKRCVVGPNPR